MASLQGYEALQKRFRAIGASGVGLTRLLGLAVVAEAKIRVPRKTSNLGRSIMIVGTTPRSVTVAATAAYAAYVERGTKPHDIRPRHRKVLRFAASAAGRRLSGSPRKGAAAIFATVVHHPGTKAQPYLVPGAIAAIEGIGAKAITDAWNRAS